MRARLNRLETSKVAKLQPRPAGFGLRSRRSPRCRVRRPLTAWPPLSATSASDRPAAPRFEVSGSLSFLQPGAGNLEYGTLTNPLPVVTPHWRNQSLKPNFAPSFSLGARYMPNESTDIQLNWTHLRQHRQGSFFASPTEMVGPPYLIGPESALYKNGSGTVKTRYDAVNLDVGHTFCAECSFQMRAFGGVSAARIGQNLSGLFASPNGAASSGYTNNSLFTGAGPRVGIKGQFGIGDFQFIGEMAAPLLVGSAQGGMDFTTLSPAFGLSSQYLASPNATRVVPSIDARLATAYTFAPSAYGLFKVEARLQGGGLFRCGQFLCGDPGADQPDASADRDLPRDAAASFEQFHQPRPLCDGQLGLLLRRGFPRRNAADSSLAFARHPAYIWDVARRWR